MLYRNHVGDSGGLETLNISILQEAGSSQASPVDRVSNQYPIQKKYQHHP
jgi:hypothetical protein